MLVILVAAMFVPAVSSPAAGAMTLGASITSTRTVVANQELTSTDSRFTAALQADGNFVVYHANMPVWSSGTPGRSGAVLSLQADGNLVLYSAEGRSLWSSGTAGVGAAVLALQDDGNLVLYAGGRARWQSGTALVPIPAVGSVRTGESIRSGAQIASADGWFWLAMQADGNLVLYIRPGVARWSSGTAGHPGAIAAMQADGNLVVYDSSGQALWQSGTAGRRLGALVVQSDGNLVVYGLDGRAGWSSDTAAPADPLAFTASWIQTVNYYRAGSGLAPVVEDPAWSDGISKHLAYLRYTPPSYLTGEYANAHSENPASPWYTPEGAAAGSSSNLGSGSNQRGAIEVWMAAPFHAIGILRPQLERSAFAMSSTGTAGLDVIRGTTATSTKSGPVLFPGPGAIIALRQFGGEYPNPLESCPGWTTQTGLPIIAMLPSDPSGHAVSATLTRSDGRGGIDADVCIVSADTYQSTDAIYGPTGKAILQADRAVLLIPRRPLAPGTQRVTLTVAGVATWEWGFTVTR